LIIKPIVVLEPTPPKTDSPVNDSGNLGTFITHQPESAEASEADEIIDND